MFGLAYRLIQLLEVLDLGIKLFEYQQRKKAPIAPVKGGGGKNQPAVAVSNDNKERLKSLENAIMNPSAARDMLRRRREMDSIRSGNSIILWLFLLFFFAHAGVPQTKNKINTIWGNKTMGNFQHLPN